MTTKQIARQWWVKEIMKDNTSNRLGVRSGYGSGKSVGAWQIMLQRMKSSPNVKQWCFTEPIYKLIKTIAIPKFEFVANSFGLLPKKDYRILRGDHLVIEFPKRNQQIFLMSCEKPENLVGFDAMFCVRDEAGLCKKESRERLASRLRDNNGAYIPQLLDVGTPEGINDFAEQYDNDSQDGWEEYAERDYIKVVTNPITKLDMIYRSFRVTTYDNERFVGMDYINSLYADYGYNQNFIRSYIYGFFTPFATGLACPNFNPKIHVLDERVEADPFKPIYMSFDFNANPVSWLVFQEYKEEIAYREFRNDFIVLDESELDYGFLRDSLTEFESKYPVSVFGETEIFIYGDRSGYAAHHQAAMDAYKEIQQELYKRGYKYVIIKAPRQVTAEATAIEAANKVFFDNRVKLNPRLRQLTKSLMSVVVKTNERKIDKPAKDTITHKYDAFKYFICHRIFKTTNSKNLSYNI